MPWHHWLDVIGDRLSWRPLSIATPEHFSNRHIERVFNPKRKDPHWGRRKLARDR
jgi:hypothetical protein